ncbi:MAG: hypothetical protein EON88_18495 [Brevundimonas sp.]|nr:MAG: hypothetical protein EON88_18495 [Brevundimonas sp.]
MIVLLTVLAFQTAYAQGSAAEEYQAPVVRPFEPTGAIDAAQGDAPPASARATPDRPVTVDGYRRSYEAPQSDGEVAYQQGVAQAELNADALSGPLDGTWLVRDGAGRTVLRLVLNDRGGGRPVEGAWMTDPASGRHAAGVIGPLTQDGARITAPLDGEGRLVLGAGMTGTLERDGRSEPVSLVRPG